MIQLSDLRVFLEIASSGSFTAAAKTLRLPKSSVARQLSRLETTLNARLVARTTRTVALTDDGRSFLAHARRLLDDSQEAMTALRPNAAAGRLTVAAPPSVARCLLAPLFAPFLVRYPDVTITLDVTGRTLDLGTADVAVCLGPIAQAGLGVRGLGRMEFVLVAAPGVLADRPPIEAPIGLSSYNMIELRPPALDGAIELSRDGRTECHRYVSVLSTDDPDIARTACLAGVGVAALPAFLAAADLRSGVLAPVLPGWTLPHAEINALYDARTAPPMRVRVFLDFLAGSLRRDGA